MYKSGDKVIVYGGTADNNGMVTSVELAVVIEVGEHQLIVKPIKSWGRPACVHIDRCQPITNKFSVPPLVPIPTMGDLMLIWEWNYGDDDIKTKVGTVHSVIHQIDGIYLEIHVESEIIKIENKKCIILQSYSRNV
jgi:hypothetical protein